MGLLGTGCVYPAPANGCTDPLFTFRCSDSRYRVRSEGGCKFLFSPLPFFREEASYLELAAFLPGSRLKEAPVSSSRSCGLAGMWPPSFHVPRRQAHTPLPGSPNNGMSTAFVHAEERLGLWKRQNSSASQPLCSFPRPPLLLQVTWRLPSPDDLCSRVPLTSTSVQDICAGGSAAQASKSGRDSPTPQSALPLHAPVCPSPPHPSLPPTPQSALPPRPSLPFSPTPQSALPPPQTALPPSLPFPPCPSLLYPPSPARPSGQP